jgi:hypothetical protein
MEIFEINNDEVVITTNCLLIPEFKKVVEAYKKNPIAPLSYINFMTNPKSPYSNLPENEKLEVVARDVGGDFTLDDPIILDAIEKAESLFMSPTRRFYFDAKIGLEKMGTYLRDGSIVTGRDGNDTTYLSMLKSVGKITAEFKILEKEYFEEVSHLRGDQEASYDEK